MRRPPTLLLAIGVVIAVAVVVAVAASGGAGQEGIAATPDASVASGSSSPAVPKVLWPAPPDPMERTVAAGLVPLPNESSINHVHAHLDVFVDGQPIAVPAGIGIDVDSPDVRRFEEPDGSVSYGGIDVCGEPCISPLHTHFATGIIHTESATPEPNTLGQFFTEWGVELSATCVGEFCSPEPIAIYVNGGPYTENPRAIELTDQKEIAIVIGTPPAEIPSTADFSQE
jgi:hypothetical protein